MHPKTDAVSATQQTGQSTQTSWRQKEALKKTCEDFEAIFIDTMFKSMRKTVGASDLITKSNAEKMYQEMLDTEIATAIARKQSLGLADQIYRQAEKYLKPGQ
ncbi:MAG: hypothetical protein CSA33_03165 [Desulfobulbus propionicus]|nr:MAG: hypothetical protein CSA33_03165 [Desulfobulbus propionicus]